MTKMLELKVGNDKPGIDFTGERFCPEVKGTIRYEHMHRYIYAERLVAGKSVIDAACGEGYGTYLLGARAASVLGIDVDVATVAHAKSRYGSENIRFSAGSLAQLPAEDASMDIAVCFETIEHVTDQPGAVAELRRVLKPDGILLISTPNADAQDGAWHENNPFHTHELSRSEFVGILKQHFPSVQLLAQRNIHGSVILPIGKPIVEGGHTVRAVDARNFSSIEEIEASYFIAVAGSDNNYDAVASLYDDSHELAGERDDFRYAVSTMHTLEKEVLQLKAANEILRIQIESLREKQSASRGN